MVDRKNQSVMCERELIACLITTEFEETVQKNRPRFFVPPDTFVVKKLMWKAKLQSLSPDEKSKTALFFFSCFY